MSQISDTNVVDLMISQDQTSVKEISGEVYAIACKKLGKQKVAHVAYLMYLYMS